MSRSRSTALVVAVATVLLSGCATAAPGTAPPAAESSPESFHVMPDGAEMHGAEHAAAEDDGQGTAHSDGHGDAHAASADGPSEAASMICAGQVVTAVTAIFALDGGVASQSLWDAPTFSCTFDIDGAPLALTVHDVTDAAAGQEHFDAVQADLGAADIEGLLGLGLPSFSTGEGIVGFLKDGRTLIVDATALPEGFGDGSRDRDGAAYAVASAVLTCWVDHD